jgi:hypothetical protein
MNTQEEIYDKAEEITEAVMALLAPTVPLTASDGSDDPNSLTYTEEARAVYEKVLGVLESVEIV